MTLLSCLSILAFEFVVHDALLLIFLFLKLLLIRNHAALDLNVLELLHSVYLLELLSQVRHQSGDILVRSELTSIANGNTTKWALFLTLSIVSLNAVRAESVEARFVDDRSFNHLLADRTCQVLLDSFDEVSADHIVQSQGLRPAMPFPILVVSMIYILTV